MMKIAVLLTCYNRKEKTLRCLKSLNDTYKRTESKHFVEIFLTDDGCTDGTSDAVLALDIDFTIHILKGSGSLYWNGGMNHSWKEAIKHGGFDGYLWLNDDTIILDDFWKDISVSATKKLQQQMYFKHNISYRIYRSWEDFEEYTLESIHDLKSEVIRNGH